MPKRTLHLLAALALALLGLGHASAEGGEQPPALVVDGYTIALRLGAGQAQTGANELVVTLRGADGAPLADAAVTAALVAYAPAEAGHSHADPPHRHTDAAADTHTDQAGHGHTDAPADQHAADEPAALAGPVTLTAAAPGSYRGALTFAQAGRATVLVAFSVGRKHYSSRFSVAVVQSRPRGLVLGGFAAVNGLVILSAALLKRRAPRRPRGQSARTPAPTPAREEHQ